MNPAKYSGRVVFLTLLSLLFVAMSLSMPWYKLSYTFDYETYYGVDTYSAESTFYVDLIYDGILFYEYPDEYPDAISYQADDMSHLMALETVLVNAWLIAGCIFVFAVLLDLRFWSFVTGGFILVVALFAIFLFVGRADDAINNPFYIPQTAALPTIDGFWGTATSADGSITCTPMKGFGWLVAAALMQVCAVSLRASVSIETVIMELKALSSAPARPATDGETTETAPEPEQPKE